MATQRISNVNEFNAVLRTHPNSLVIICFYSQSVPLSVQLCREFVDMTYSLPPGFSSGRRPVLFYTNDILNSDFQDVYRLTSVPEVIVFKRDRVHKRLSGLDKDKIYAIAERHFQGIE